MRKPIYKLFSIIYITAGNVCGTGPWSGGGMDGIATAAGRWYVCIKDNNRKKNSAIVKETKKKKLPLLLSDCVQQRCRTMHQGSSGWEGLVALYPPSREHLGLLVPTFLPPASRFPGLAEYSHWNQHKLKHNMEYSRTCSHVVTYHFRLDDSLFHKMIQSSLNQIKHTLMCIHVQFNDAIKKNLIALEFFGKHSVCFFNRTCTIVLIRSEELRCFEIALSI